MDEIDEKSQSGFKYHRTVNIYIIIINSMNMLCNIICSLLHILSNKIKSF